MDELGWLLAIAKFAGTIAALVWFFWRLLRGRVSLRRFHRDFR